MCAGDVSWQPAGMEVGCSWNSSAKGEVGKVDCGFRRLD